MKLLKTLLVILCLSVSVSFYAQTKPVVLTKSSVFNFQASNPKQANQTFKLKELVLPDNTNAISLYNKTTNLFDTYSLQGTEYVYSNSHATFQSQSGFLSDVFLGKDFLRNNNPLAANNYFKPNDYATYRIRDSFNPYGASTIGEALLGGVFGLLFD